MNLNITILKNLSFVLFLSLLIATGCTEKPNGSSESEHTYLVEYQKLHTLQKNIIIATQAAVAIQYPEMDKLKDSTRYTIDVYRIVYRTKYKDTDVMASGLACIPSDNGVFPILSIQNGTNTAHDRAPTENSGNTNFLLLQGLAGNGYIILIPDYIGFGSSDSIVHPYYVKEPTIDAVIDMIRATKEFIDNYIEDAIYSQDCYLAGYSQGGWATLAALDAIENGEINDIFVKATSCGAGAYDLLEVTHYLLGLDSYPGPYYLPYYMYSHQQYGIISDPMQKYFREPYASMIPELFDGSLSNLEVKDELTDSIPALLTADFMEHFSHGPDYKEIRADMLSNSVSAWKTTSKLRFYHGTNDAHVPISQSKNMYQDFQAAGSADFVEYFDIPDVDHNEGILPWGIATLVWFNELQGSYQN